MHRLRRALAWPAGDRERARRRRAGAKRRPHHAELVRRVIERNESVQSKVLEFELNRRQHAAELGADWRRHSRHLTHGQRQQQGHHRRPRRHSLRQGLAGRNVFSNAAANATNAAAIGAIFTQGGVTLRFDLSGQDRQGLAAILLDLRNLVVSSAGNLAGPTP